MKSQIIRQAIAALLLSVPAWAQVKLIKVSDDALQPRALADAAGTTHLIAYRGEASGGDLFYATKASGGSDFGKAVRVNSEQRSAVSMGTIRGGQMALGKDSQVHIVWNGSRARKRDQAPLFYKHSVAGGGFEEQRALSGDWIMDGGGAVAADSVGNVYVFYHGGKGSGEETRRVIVRISHDSGATFEPEKIISPEGLGVCGCCAMQAFADSRGRLFVIYRTASDGGRSRDIATMFSSDHGKTWTHSIASRWKIAACPMSSMSIAQAGSKVLMAWEKEGRIFVGEWDDAAGKIGTISTLPGAPAQRKHPALASDASGRILAAWTEGTGWNKGGSAAWQMLDAKLRPQGELGTSAGVPVWSFVSPVPDGAGGFQILH